MQQPITTDIVVAYTHCPRKAFLLLCTDERGIPHAYAQMLARQQHVTATQYVTTLTQRYPQATPYAGLSFDAGQGPLLAATLRTQDLEAACAVLMPVTPAAAAPHPVYEATTVVGTQTISREQHLELLFVSYVLGQVQQTLPTAGAIVGLGGQVKQVSLVKAYPRLEPILNVLRAWTASPAPAAPPVILNDHCPQCPFRTTCTAQAEHDDDLNLLERMTPQARQRYHDRGIFTVKQLSYLFKPRRQHRGAKPAPVHHRLELQAIALRTEKTYLQELPALDRHPIELFLDIEGTPDRHVYYLIGLLVCKDGRTTYRSFWADRDADEAHIWQQFLAALGDYPDAPIYHYGSYEPRAMATLAKRYGTADEQVTKRFVNITSFVYGKVYFPVRSNRLKDLGRFLHSSWSSPEASGLHSLVCRQRWEESQREEDKRWLLTYNREDCSALRAVTDALTRLRDAADSEPAVDFADHPKRQATETGVQLHRHFETILQSAHDGYEQGKISLRQHHAADPSEAKRRGARTGHPGYRWRPPKARTVVRLPQRATCPLCDNHALQTLDAQAEKTLVDLVFTENGCRKTIRRYIGAYGYCRCCGRRYPPLAISGSGNQLFGRGFQAWIVYQRLVLRLPYAAITQLVEEQFNESISQGTIVNMLTHCAQEYAAAEEDCRQRLLSSSFVHVDETKVNIQGVQHYVWVFTTGHHVLFKLTATREAAIVHEVLAGYSGVLISDFYGGYDAMHCRQQKCLVHLIRDLNDDLWRAPFDAELEGFVLEVKDLLVPILGAVDTYGLKKRHLGRFTRQVEQFYKTVIEGRVYRSPLVLTYQKG